MTAPEPRDSATHPTTPTPTRSAVLGAAEGQETAAGLVHPSWEYREDADGLLDEVVVRHATLVHVEMLARRQAYLQFHFDDGSFGQVEIMAGKGGLLLTASEYPADHEATR